MERKRNGGIHHIFRVAFDRLFHVKLDMVNINDCPAGLEFLAVARIRRKATVKMRRKPLLRFLSMIPISSVLNGSEPIPGFP